MGFVKLDNLKNTNLNNQLYWIPVITAFKVAQLEYNPAGCPAPFKPVRI